MKFKLETVGGAFEKNYNLALTNYNYTFENEEYFIEIQDLDELMNLVKDLDNAHLLNNTQFFRGLIISEDNVLTIYDYWID